ncbi:hypothetical protein G9A89_004613 [Geosiphon pyriformis]|nr:hypothetical protein G9A89_004613 [Geosiphon pyriformis]
MRFIGVLSVLVSLGAIIGVLLSFPRKFPLPPTQTISPVTKYPTWHQEIHGLDEQTLNTFHLFSLFTTGLGASVSIYWTLIRTQPTFTISYFQNESGDIYPATVFNAVIAFYILSTFFSALIFILADISKFLGVIGIFHNAAELTICLLIFNGGKIGSNYDYLLIFGYTFSAANAISFFKWPFDALFFKTQGLVFDWMLVIVFTLIIIKTNRKNKQNIQGHIPLHIDNDLKDHEKDSLHERVTLLPKTVQHSQQLWILWIASVFHIIGNILITLLAQVPAGTYAFQATYPISFPLYAYYTYLDTHCTDVNSQKRIYLPRKMFSRTLAILFWSMSLAFLTTRFLIIQMVEDQYLLTDFDRKVKKFLLSFQPQ